MKKTTLNPPETTLTNVEGKFTLNDVEGGLSIADRDFKGNFKYIYENTDEADAELVVHITTDATDFAEGLDTASQKRQYKASAKVTMKLYNNIYSCALAEPSSSPSGGGNTCSSSSSPIVCNLPPRGRP